VVEASRKPIVMVIVFLAQEICQKMIFVQYVLKSVSMIKETMLIESSMKNTAI
jgi:hypothetical protein